MYKAEKRLCLNADKSAIVDCESPEAAWQLASEGGQVSEEDAERYGLVKAKAVEEVQAEADALADQVPQGATLTGDKSDASEAPAKKDAKAEAAPPQDKAVAAPSETKAKK